MKPTIHSQVKILEIMATTILEECRKTRIMLDVAERPASRKGMSRAEEIELNEVAARAKSKMELKMRLLRPNARRKGY